MRRDRIGVAATVLLAWTWASPGAEASGDEPAFLSGMARLVAGPAIELPAAVIEYTLTQPLLIGTATGLVAGTIRAVRMMADGAREFVTVPFQPPLY